MGVSYQSLTMWLIVHITVVGVTIIFIYLRRDKLATDLQSDLLAQHYLRSTLSQYELNDIDRLD